MKKLLLILFALMFSLPCEASLSHNTHITHTGLKPVPNSFQVARSRFLPEYQAGEFSFDNSEDISVACPTSVFMYTKDNCAYPNIPQYSCGGRYRVCGCDRSFAYSAAQCEAMGKVGGDQSCTVRGGSDSGTVYYTTCKCPSSYPKLTTGQKCVGGTECSYAGEKYCDSTSHIQCESNYKVCDQNKSGRSGSCTAGGVTKYIDCYCDENLYPQTNETCKADFGTNAVISGEICGNNERGKSCSCEPVCPASHPDKSCGTLGASEETDDGCGGKCYKCNPAANTDAPDYNSLCGTNSGGSISACKKFIKDTWNWRNLEDDMSDLISRLPLNSKGKCDVWQGWCWQRVQGENDTALTFYVVFSDKTINATQTSVGMGYGNLVGLDGFVAYYNIGNSVHKANFIKNCCGLNPKPTVTFSNVTYYGLQKFSYIKSLNLKFTSPATIKAEEVRGVNLTNVTVDNAKIECSSKITGSNKNAFKNVTATGGISGCQ